MGFKKGLIVGALVLGTTGCFPGEGVTARDGTTSAAQIDQKCTTPENVSGRPTNVAETVSLINALPKPTSLGCFLDALEHPLKIVATSNQLSAQPAAGARSPRIFIVNAGLILSVVPAGVGADRLELSESAPYAQSTKAEIVFPVLSILSASAPYDGVRYGAGTTCRSCHASEVAVPDDATHSGAYASNKVYPDPTYLVSLASLLSSEQTCQPSAEPYRCRILSAVVGPSRDAYSGSY
ncbi:MAG: hypothetical protein JST04_15330 [Bdellovibrionales bacterium]|nr:hypothetical protein [Bdellovibrionales bacterium]